MGLSRAIAAGPFSGSGVSISSAMLCGALSTLCGVSNVCDETAEDKTEGLAEERRESEACPR